MRASIEAINADDFNQSRVLAFAGIGQPSKFYDSLRKAGAQIIQTRDFSDHHPFTAQELGDLRADAARLDARLVSTQKDLMRLPLQDRDGISSLDIRLVFEAPDQLAKIVTSVLADG